MRKTSDVWKAVGWCFGGWRRPGRLTLCVAAWRLATASASAHGFVPGPSFDFRADTFDFANQTVYIYPHGYAEKRTLHPGEQAPAFTLHCFGMSRSTEQFRNFARFEPSLPPPDDDALARVVRRVMRRAVWRDPVPPAQRVVIPGYANLRALSHARPLVLQENLGWGWMAYLRPGNYRMFHFWWNGPGQQAATQRQIADALRRNDLFLCYLTSFPDLSINHSVLIYGCRPPTRAEAASGVIHYLVYDPNHPEAPRDLAYDTRRREFSFQKDWDFVGGKVTVLQVYNYPVQ